MCTLSVLKSDGHCLITMNRDDLVERPEAPPSPLGVGRDEVIAPLDLKAGGTWIGLNQFGLVGCLLNRYDQHPPLDARSRGGIVPEILRQAAYVDEAASQVAKLALEKYAPFTCVLLSREDTIRLDWTGTRLLTEVIANQPSWMITSSSVSECEVRTKRNQLFIETPPGFETVEKRLARFHAQSAPSDAWWSPWMQRPLAHTKSITQVLLEPHTSQMRYWDRQAVLVAGLVDAPYVVKLKRATLQALA
jgi:hypothetical protein